MNTPKSSGLKYFSLLVVLVIFSLLAMFFLPKYGIIPSVNKTNITNISQGYVCIIYITKIGCPNCAITDSMIFTEWTRKYDKLVVIEYESHENLDTINSYIENCGADPFVPQILFANDTKATGLQEVLAAEETIKSLPSNPCLLPNGFTINFSELDLSSLPGKPKIWSNGKVIVPGASKINQTILKSLIHSQNPPEFLRAHSVEFELVNPQPMEISHGYVYFRNAIKIGDWLIEW